MGKRIASLLATMAVMGFCAGSAAAETWPSHPIRLTVPYAPGGTVDTVARFISEKMATQLGQPLVVENKPGAGGNIGTQAVVRAPADGYTLLVAGSPTHVLNPHLYKNPGFDPIQDLSAIALIGTAPNLLVVNPRLPVHSVRDLVEMARKDPGALAFSSSGRGTTGHLAGELLSREAKIDIRHVPYKGQADAITGVIRGDVAFAFVTIPGTLSQVTAGNLRAVAITSKERSELAPQIPTVVESGYPDFEVLAWYNLSAPAGVPAHIIDALKNALTAVMNDSATKQRFSSLGLESNLLTGEPYMQFMESESDKWGAIIKDAGLGDN